MNEPRRPRHEHAGDAGLSQRLRSEVPRITRQHEGLGLFFRMLQEALEVGSMHRARTVFTRLCDALRAHMQVEDDILFPALHGLAPSADAALERLVREHAYLREEIERLTEVMAEGSLEVARQIVPALEAELRAHERREEELVSELSGVSVPDPFA